MSTCGAVAVLALGVTLVWGGGLGAAIGVVGAILIGAWILMTDGDDGKATNGRPASGVFGTSSSGAGGVDRKARAAAPPNLK